MSPFRIRRSASWAGSSGADWWPTGTSRLITVIPAGAEYAELATPEG